MAEAHPVDQFCRYRQNVPEHIDLKLVKILIDRRVQQGFKFVKAFFNLLLRFRIIHLFCAMLAIGLDSLESEFLWWGGQQPRLQAPDSLVNKVVD